MTKAWEITLGKLEKKPYKMNLMELHGICELNYARLIALFPDYQNSNTKELLVGAAKVQIHVIERCRYTTFFRIIQKHPETRWLGLLSAEVRAYHDARMLEVGEFQAHRRAAPRYQYPNRAMMAQDEKFQQNRFLAEWLEHCLQNGRSDHDVYAPLSGAE